jgi:hypothetical protein
MEKEQKGSSVTSYVNPENYNEVVEEIKNAEKHDQVIEIINKTFPRWILGWPKRYCQDYPHFQNNWEFVCKKTGCSSLSVIIVDYVDFKSPQYKLIRMFCELLTLFGHSVRRKEEFIGCKVCGDAIPTQKVYKQLLERKVLNIPKVWSLRCKNC